MHVCFLRIHIYMLVLISVIAIWKKLVLWLNYIWSLHRLASYFESLFKIAARCYPIVCIWSLIKWPVHYHKSLNISHYSTAMLQYEKEAVCEAYTTTTLEWFTHDTAPFIKITGEFHVVKCQLDHTNTHVLWGFIVMHLLRALWRLHDLFCSLY